MTPSPDYRGALLDELDRNAGAIAMRVDASTDARTEIAAGTLPGRAAAAIRDLEADRERLTKALVALVSAAEQVRQMLDRDITRQGPDMRAIGIPFVAAINKARALSGGKGTEI